MCNNNDYWYCLCANIAKINRKLDSIMKDNELLHAEHADILAALPSKPCCKNKKKEAKCDESDNNDERCSSEEE